jgi:4-hydroxy-tetrahydrodipicolinate synthase
LRFFNFFKALFVESNPIPVKAALGIKGFIKDELRLPLVMASDKTIEILKDAMKRSGIADSEVA